MQQSFYSTDYFSFKKLLVDNGCNSHAARFLHNWHLKKKQTTECPETIGESTRRYIHDNFHFELPCIETALEARDSTVKFLFKLHDGRQVETVLIPFNNKYSICVSSQVGCAMNCSFCFTGTQGFKRNLETSEIVGQYLGAWRWLKTNRPGEERILNIVFMGQGEPLHNFNSVKKACEIFTSTYGTSVGYQRITVSTSGFLPGLKRWNEEMPGVNLALSLHSPFTEKRNELIPINKKYPLEEVLNYIDGLKLQKKQFVTYEYLVVDDFNDSEEDAHATGKLLQGKRAYINLIAFNPFPGSKYRRPTVNKLHKFKAILDTYKIPVLVRETKGDDILAACGQLNTAPNVRV